jgi:hypothetical protein
MFIGDAIKSDEADGYCVFIEGFRMWVEKNSLGLSPEQLVEIADAGITTAESSAKNIMDGDYWQMGIDDLRALRMKIANKY